MFLRKFAEDGFAVLGTMISNVTFLKTKQGFGLYISAWKPPKKLILTCLVNDISLSHIVPLCFSQKLEPKMCVIILCLP